MTKYIFVAGGVMSGIGKGTAVSSIGKILQARGFTVTAMKIDPYINVDAGTMNPIEHGEVFVTEDGDETDQDLGNYERFLNLDMSKINYMTTGRVYSEVIKKERNLEYGGRCVEVVPHIPEEVIRRIKLCAKKTKADIVLIEIGGTVGEYQNILFLEAARMLRLQEPENVLFILLTYLPIPSKIGEMKTKPTQTAVRTLNETGIQPDIILCRAEKPIDEPRKRKISLFCNVAPHDIISAPDVESIYEIPLNFERELLSQRILERFKLRPKHKDLREWKNLVSTISKPQRTVSIGIVGKYFETGDFVLTDSYLSVIEAVKHASYFFKAKPKIFWLSSEDFERDPKKIQRMQNFDGIIVPGGFGKRGVEGKIKAIEFVRKNNIPFLGLCFGMQLAVAEFARNVAGLKRANSEEVDPKTPHPVIHLMSSQSRVLQEKKYGGTMRLGAYPCILVEGTAARALYGKTKVSERHRHRYEVNNAYRERLSQKGLTMSGISPDGLLVEIVELKNHPFFIGVQFHPEFKSRPLSPHPVYREFIRAALKRGKGYYAKRD